MARRGKFGIWKFFRLAAASERAMLIYDAARDELDAITRDEKYPAVVQLRSALDDIYQLFRR